MDALVCQSGSFLRVAQEKRPKSGLFEMSVRSERFPDIALRHHGEGRAVGQAPLFVGSRGEKADRLAAQAWAVGNDLDPRIAKDTVESLSRYRACPNA